MRTITRRFAAWIACFAMLFAALAPSVSHALAISQGETWSEICSVAGKKFVRVGFDQGEPGDKSSQDGLHLEHCPFCATHAGTLFLPPNAGLTIALIDTQAMQPYLFLRSPRPLAIWTNAQSRAPPVSI